MLPMILPYEVGNALSAMVKRGRLTDAEATDAFKRSQQIPVQLVAVAIEQALAFAFKLNIYAYDAYFLECARALNYPLLTLDKGMKKTARQMNLVVLE